MHKGQRLRSVAGWAALGCTLLLSFAVKGNAQLQAMPLDDGWRFHALRGGDHAEATTWRPAVVPGVVQSDLYRNALIPDPFFGDNEKRLQWIGLTDWEYTKDLKVSPAMLQHDHLELVFDGLDTFSDVLLNGKTLLSTDNMFRSWRVDVKEQLHAGQNRLTVVFHSPTNRIAPMVAKLPYIFPARDTSRWIGRMAFFRSATTCARLLTATGGTGAQSS